MKRHLLWIISIVVIGTSSLVAQDIHFSQFYNSPLTLNPASTGMFDGTYRGAGIHRSQWGSVATRPYTTFAGSFDYRHVPIRKSPWAFGIGGSLFSDKSGSGKLKNSTLAGSGGIHRVINGKHQVSLGLHVAFVQRKIDFNELFFHEQFSGLDFDKTLDPGETFGNDKFSYTDFSAGLAWQGVLTDKFAMSSGVALFHLTTPEESFGFDRTNRLSRRFAFHANASYALTEIWGLLPGFLTQMQSGAQEIAIGSNVGYAFENISVITKGVAYFGLWYRFSVANSGRSDALIPKVGLKYKEWTAMLSYDVNVSRLRQASSFRGGPEISVIYIKKIVRPLDQVTIPCLRF